MYRLKIMMLPLLSVLVVFTLSLETSAVEAASAGIATAGSDCGVWNVVPSPSPGSVNQNLLGVAALSSNTASAVGYYETSNLLDLTLIEHWNGKQWSVVSSPNEGEANLLNAVASVPGTRELWAVGSYVNHGGILQTLTEHYC